MTQTWIFGRKGTQASASNDNGGAIEDGGAATYDTMQLTNAAALFVDLGVAFADISEADPCVIGGLTGVGALVPLGTYVNIVWNAGGNFVSDRYQITATTANSISIDYDTSILTKPTGNATKVYLGGALGGTAGANTRTVLQIVFDGLTAGDTVSIAQGTFTIDGTAVDVDQNTGANGTRMNIQGVNAVTGDILTVGETRPIIQANASIADKSPLYITNTMLYYDWRFLDLRGGGANKADHAWFNNDSNSTNHRMFNCKLSASDKSCLNNIGHNFLAKDCEIFGGLGASAGNNVYLRGNYSKMIDCIVRDGVGGANGIRMRTGGGVVSGCRIYGNAAAGILVNLESAQANITNNTIYNNTGAGLDINTAADNIVAYNNIVSGNGGTQWELNSNATHFALFTNNHAFGGTGLVDAGTWADIGDGNNITGDPQFVDAANGDFRIQNLDVLTGGKPDADGRGTVMGAQSPKLLDLISRTRARYDEATHGWAI